MATITASLGDGTAVSIQARQFTWQGDEPLAAGGTDTGPTPYARIRIMRRMTLLLGALSLGAVRPPQQ